MSSLFTSVSLFGKSYFKPARAQQSVHLTLGILAKISSSFTRLVIFLVGRLRRPRPSAGNANRWAAGANINKRN
jgi:hypothetical protein